MVLHGLLLATRVSLSIVIVVVVVVVVAVTTLW